MAKIAVLMVGFIGGIWDRSFRGGLGQEREAALALPHAYADMMQLHLDEFSRNIAEGAHPLRPAPEASCTMTGISSDRCRDESSDRFRFPLRFRPWRRRSSRSLAELWIIACERGVRATRLRTVATFDRCPFQGPRWTHLRRARRPYSGSATTKIGRRRSSFFYHFLNPSRSSP